MGGDEETKYPMGCVLRAVFVQFLPTTYAFSWNSGRYGGIYEVKLSCTRD
jgi:hypothetical protein